MKVTAQIPDELYRQVKAKAARDGKAVREVTEALYRAYVAVPDAAARIRDGEEWLKQWLNLAHDEATVRSADGPSAREHLEEARGRLDRG